MKNSKSQKSDQSKSGAQLKKIKEKKIKTKNLISPVRMRPVQNKVITDDKFDEPTPTINQIEDVDVIPEASNDNKMNTRNKRTVKGRKTRNSFEKQHKKHSSWGQATLTESELQKYKDDVRRVKQQCKADGLDKKRTISVVTKWKRREQRRLERMKERERQKICFGCRQTGHSLAQCPQSSSDQQAGVGICFKCGSTEHKSSACKVKTKGFPYAKCFVCNKIGHLSRDCEENSHGAYPLGGNCKQCGKTDHLIRDCPEVKKKQDSVSSIVVYEARSMDSTSATSLDVDIPAAVQKSHQSKKHAAKVVKF